MGIVIKADTRPCNICGRFAYHTTTGRVVRDHDHRTGWIRGLLCDLCNAYVGVFEAIRAGRRRKSAPPAFKHWRKHFHAQILRHLASNTGVPYPETPVLKAVSLLCFVCRGVSRMTNTDGVAAFLECGHSRPLSHSLRRSI